MKTREIGGILTRPTSLRRSQTPHRFTYVKLKALPSYKRSPDVNYTSAERCGVSPYERRHALTAASPPCRHRPSCTPRGPELSRGAVNFSQRPPSPCALRLPTRTRADVRRRRRAALRNSNKTAARQRPAADPSNKTKPKPSSTRTENP